MATTARTQVFRSSGEAGFSAEVSGNPRRVHARKLEREVSVRFTPRVCNAQPGDAIITGTAGEHWRVSRARFPAKYRPVPPTPAGEAGIYVSLPYRILAVPMSEPFEVLLADRVSRLTGGAGDWLVDYGDGSFGVVSAAIFAGTYEIVE